jgi:MFS family permease
MASQAFFYNGIFYTYTLILQNFYFIEKQKVGLFLIPLSVASFCGPLLLGKYFDSWSRRKMIALTFILSGILLTISATNFLFEFFGLFTQQIFWFCTFFVASPAASSAHLTVSEIFPTEIRSQAMAIFFSTGLGVGGVVSPFFFGWMVSNKDKKEIFFSYLFAAGIMMLAGLFGYFFGVDAENKSLEQITRMDKGEDRNSGKYANEKSLI